MSGFLPIDYERTTLQNGLTVIVSEDHRVPLVNVRLWYRVGAQQGPYAHLFEHVFWRSEAMERDFKAVLPEIGALIVDANTRSDRTNYFETVPTGALDAALWLESSRMGAPIFPQHVLDNERSIVRNEIKLRKRRASYRIFQETLAGAYPSDHPYSRIVGATDEELSEATVEDMRAWHRSYYGAANAILLLTGDVSTDEAFQKAERYFGDVRPGPPVDRTKKWVARHTETRRRHMTTDVSAPELHMAWNVPPWGAADIDDLRLIADLLANGDAARLRTRLVATEELATEVKAVIMAREIGSLFMVEVTASPGADLRRIETIVWEEISRLSREGPADGELKHIKAQHRLAFAKEREQLGRWTEGTSNILARGEAYRGIPHHYRRMLERIRTATPDDVARTAETWLREGAFVLHVVPTPSHTAGAPAVDRTQMPPLGDMPDVPRLPQSRASLHNGLDVVIASREESELITAMLLVQGAGYAEDPPGASGQAQFLLSLLERSMAIQANEQDRFASLGATIESGATMDAAWIQVTALRTELATTLRLLTEGVRHPMISDQVVGEVREHLRAKVVEELREHTAKRFLPPLLYGNAHPYGRPFTGTGRLSTLDAWTPPDLRESYAQLYRPDRSTLIVAGEISRSNVMPVVGDTLGTWSNSPASASTLDVLRRRDMPTPASSRIYVVDQPEARLASLYAAQLVPADVHTDRAAFLAMRSVLGAFDLQGRLNRNLREDKGWTYNASILSWPRLAGPEPLVAYTSVQADQAAAAMKEIRSEWQTFGRDRPVTPDELQNVKQTMKLKMISFHETLHMTTHLLRTQIASGLPGDSHVKLAADLDRLTPSHINDLARRILRSDELVWVIVGDLETIGEDIRALGWGDMHHLELEEAPPSTIEPAGL